MLLLRNGAPPRARGSLHKVCLGTLSREGMRRSSRMEGDLSFSGFAERRYVLMSSGIASQIWPSCAYVMLLWVSLAQAPMTK